MKSRFGLPAILLCGDLIALLLFVYIGQSDHDLVDAASPVWGVLRAGWPFVLAWVVSGLWLGAFPQAQQFSAPAFLSRSLNAWLVAALLGLLLRSHLLGRAVLPTLFVEATLAFGGLFVLGWRLVFVLARRAWAARVRAARVRMATSQLERINP